MSKVRKKPGGASAAAHAALDAVVARADEKEQLRDEQEAQRADAASRASVFGRGFTLGALIAILAAVNVWNLNTLSHPPAPVAREVFEATARMNLAIIAQEVEAYVAEHGELPESLDQFGYEDEHVRLAIVGNSYRLISDEVQPPITFEGGSDPSLLLYSAGSES